MLLNVFLLDYLMTTAFPVRDPVWDATELSAITPNRSVHQPIPRWAKTAEHSLPTNVRVETKNIALNIRTTLRLFYRSLDHRNRLATKDAVPFDGVQAVSQRTPNIWLTPENIRIVTHNTIFWTYLCTQWYWVSMSGCQTPECQHQWCPLSQSSGLC